MVLFAVSTVGAQDPSPITPAKTKEKSKSVEPPSPDKKGVGFWQAPAGAIMVLCEQASDSLKLLPKMVVLPPEKYQEIMDELSKLKEQQVEVKSQAPSLAQITGKVEGGLAKLKIRFSFQTEKPASTVFLGCAQGQASSAMMAGKIPLLKKNQDGFVVIVESPGAHDLDLELLVAVRNLGENQSFELDLPGAAITQMELDMPAGTLNPKITSKSNQEALVNFKGNRLSATLGPLTLFQTTWKSSQRDSQPKALTSETNILVRLDDKIFNARAEIKIGALGGRLDVLDLVVPLGSEMRPFSPADEARISSIEKIDQKFASYRKIKLKDSSSDPLRVVVESQANIPVNGGQLPIGPYMLSGAIRQTGVILISNQGNDLKVSNQPRGEIISQEVTAQDKQRDPNTFASFRYWNHPFQEKPGALTGPNSLSLLDLQLDLIRGILEVKTINTVRMARRDNNQWFWNITTTFDCTPVRTGSDKIEIRVPSGITYDENKGPVPSNIIRDVAYDSKTGKLQVQFSQELLNHFQFSLDFQEAFTPDELVRVTLPQPMQVRDRGGVINLVTPDDYHLFTGEKLNASLDLVSNETHKQVWKSDKFVQKLDAILKLADDKTQVRQTVDIHLNGSGTICRQQMHLQFLGRVPTMVALSVPAEISDRMHLLKGGRIEGLDAKTGILSVALSGSNKETDLEFEYEYPVLPDAMSLRFSLPGLLNSIEDTQVRLWARPGMTIISNNDRWREHPIEVVAKNPRLPNACFQGEKNARILEVELSAGSPFGPAMGKILARAKLDRNQVMYRVSYHYKNSMEQNLEFIMPANFQDARLTVNGLDMNWQYVTQGKNRTKVSLPQGLVEKPFVLEWEYLVPRPMGIFSSFQNQLSIPVFENQAVGVDWWIKLPSGRVALLPEPTNETAKQWHRDGIFLALDTLLAPRDFEVTQQEDLNGPSSFLDSSNLVIYNSPQTSITLLHFSGSTLKAFVSLFVFLVILSGVGLVNHNKSIAALTPWLIFCLFVSSTVFHILFPLLSAKLFLGLQPALYTLAAGVLIMQLKKYLSLYQSANLPSFSRTKASISTIKPTFNKPQVGVTQQAVARESNESTGYWVRPDPSVPDNSNSKNSASNPSLVHDVLPD